MTMKRIKAEGENERRREKETRRRGDAESFSFFKSLVFSSIAIVVLFGGGCQPNQTILKDAAPPPTPLETVEMKKTSLEEDLREMETADFDYIFVFRRKDGGVFDKDDQ